MTSTITEITFTSDDTDGYFVRDFFDGVEFLEDGETFLDRINASFASDALAIDWLRKSYKGADSDGVGVIVDDVAL